MDGNCDIILCEFIGSALSDYMKPYGFHVGWTQGMINIELPYVIRVSFPLEACDWMLVTAIELSMKIMEFINHCYSEERMMTEGCIEKFLALPVKIEFISDADMHLYLRVAMIAAESRFGKSKIIKGIFINDSTIVLITRAGRFYVHIRDFRKNLLKSLENMGHFMRKPLRKKFDKICEEKKSEKE